MPTYRVETNKGTFDVEADREPTVADIESHLASNDDVAARRARVAESPGESIQRGPRAGGMGLGTAVDLTLEAGIPMLAQAITSPLAELGVTSAVGSGASILGNILAQTRRVAMGEQEGFKGGQVAQAGLSGAVPFLGPAKNANRLLQSAKTVGLNAAMQGAGGLAGSVAQNFIDEGSLPSGGEALITTTLPAIMGAGGSTIAEYGARKTLRSRRILENADIFGAADVTPTPGMLLPEELASIEQKLARDRRGGVEASRIDQTRQQMIDRLNDAGGGAAREGAEIFSDLKPLLGQVTTAEDEIAKLTSKAIAARKAAGEKFRALREAEKGQKGDIDTEVRKAAETAMNAEYDANLEAILGNARELVTERVAGRRVSGLDPATFRDLTVEHVALPLRAAFKERADQMYSLVDNTIKGFDAAPILAEAEAITRTASGRLPTDLQQGVNDLRALLQTADEGMNVSLQDLRRARDQLLSRVDTGVPISSDEQRLVTGITKKISSEIEKQAPKVFGAEGAQALKDANKYYAEVRPLFDKPGVKVLFSNDPADEYVGKVLRGIQSSGTNSDEYRNVMTLVDEVRKTHPEQAGAIEDLFKSNLKESILFRARGKNLNPATGEYEVDARELIKTLEPMGNTPGTLEALGFGNKEQLAEMKKLFSDYPDASKLSDVQWEALWASPLFREKARVLPVQNVEVPKDYTKPAFESGKSTTVYASHGLPPKVTGMVEDTTGRGAVFYSTHQPSAASYSTARQWEPLAQRVNNPPEGVVAAAKILDLDAKEKIFDFNFIDPKDHPEIVERLKDPMFRKQVDDYRSDSSEINRLNRQSQSEHVQNANLRVDKLQIENPLVIDYEGRPWGWIKDDEGKWVLPSVSRRSGRDPARDFQDRVFEQAKNAGHDAVIFKNIQDVGFSLPGEKPIGDTIALLRSTQREADEAARRLKPAIEPFLAASAADTKLVRSVAEWKAGKVAASQRTYQEARDTLKQVNGDLAALQSRRDSLLRDPVAVALDNPNLPRESYDGFARAFFDPAPSKVTNEDLAGVVSAMEKGPRPVRETLNRLRERYIADRIAVFKAAPESSRMAQELDTGKIRQFFEPTSPGDPANELARAQTILTKEQLGRLDDLAGVIRQVDLYERFGPGLIKPGSYNVPTVGASRRILDTVIDLYRGHKYDSMAEMILDPAKFARSQRISGDRMIQGGGVIQQAGQGAARVLSR